MARLKAVPRDPIVFVCMRRAHGGDRRCNFCSKQYVALCDYPKPGGKTCDKHMCGAHRNRVGADKDYCPDCILLAARAGSA